MKKSDATGGLKPLSFLTISLLTTHIILGLTYFLIEVDAEQREFEVFKAEENITIPQNEIRAINFYLMEGAEFEVLYTLQVKENLPLDIWFVTQDHFLLLQSGNFLYFVDGSHKEVIYTRKIVTLTKPNTYKLAKINYNNQSVEVNAKCEIRTFLVDSGETTSDDSSIYLYPLLIAVIVLVVLLVVLILKNRKYKQAMTKVSKRTSPKEFKHKKRKIKEKKNMVPKKIIPKEEKTHKIEETDLKEPEKDKPSFCGYCGKPVDTTFCKYCGRKV